MGSVSPATTRCHAKRPNPSLVRLNAFGTIKQFHKPQFFNDKSHPDSTANLLQQFEGERKKCRLPIGNPFPFTSGFEKGGETTGF